MAETASISENQRSPSSIDGGVGTTSGQKSLPPHYSLKANDTDPELGKKIKEIVLCTETFIVYIDSDNFIQWHTTDDHKDNDSRGEILNLVAKLESQSSFIKDKEAIFQFRKRIAEGLSSCLYGYPKETCITILEETAADLKSRNKDESWVWYFQYAGIATILFAIFFMALWLKRSYVRDLIGIDAFDVLLGSICGTFGALVSVASRSNDITLDANAGKYLHIFEGLSRLFTGLIGALITALSIKSGFILGSTVFSGNQFALLLCLCVCAGAAERILPSMVKNVERVI